MRRIITAITAFAMALSMLATAQAAPAAAAVTGFNSDYFGESAFLGLAPGQAGQFAVGFNNTGATGWQLGTSSQVDLGICQADKTTCNVASPNASWASNWYSSIAYATQSTSFVGPGQTGWFVYGVRAPSSSTTGAQATFNGDLVLHSTLQQIRPQGYYQVATVTSAATVPTQLALAPAFQSKQIGQTASITATVTADPPTGSTTRQPVANTEVTFQVPADNLNPAITATAITDASGNATFSYTRNNPSTTTDTITAYVTAAPTVRSTAQAVWGTSATTITVTTTGGGVSPNTDTDGTTATTGKACTAYSFTAKDTSGNPIASLLKANFVENLAASAATPDNDGGATITAGASTNPVVAAGPPTSPTNNATSVALNPNTDGTGTFTVCAGVNTNTKTVTPYVFWDNNTTNSTKDTAELAGYGTAITFATRTPTITVTPDGSTSLAAGTEQVYTVQAADQFGAPFQGQLVIGSVEYTDNLVGTSTTATVAWVDNRATATGIPSTTPQPGCGSAANGVTPAVANATPTDPGGTTKAIKNANTAPNTSGTLTFALCSTSATTATGIAFQDKDTNFAFAADEPKDTGTAVTWSAAVLTSCSIAASPTVAPSSTTSDPTVATPGDVTYTITLKDQGGSPFTETGTFKFAVTNTGTSATQEADTNGNMVAAGATVNVSHTPGAASSNTMKLDEADAGSASVAGTFTRASDSVAFTCGTATNTWIAAVDASTLAAGSTISGTVIFVDKAANNGGAGCTTATTDGCGAYVIQTSASGNFYVTFDGTATSNDTFLIVGTTSTGIQFEAALSIGDVVTVTTTGGAQFAGTWNHNMTTNAP